MLFNYFKHALDTTLYNRTSICVCQIVRYSNVKPIWIQAGFLGPVCHQLRNWHLVTVSGFLKKTGFWCLIVVFTYDFSDLESNNFLNRQKLALAGWTSFLFFRNWKFSF
jgi:hypothetical protein